MFFINYLFGTPNFDILTQIQMATHRYEQVDWPSEMVDLLDDIDL